MCSQPPRKVQDDWIVDDIAQAIPLIDSATKEIGFTGVEPTLLGERFFDLLRLAKNYLPNTAVHVLSNGPSFADPSVAARYARVDHPDLMVGIPLYSDLSTIHDYVVQADGAYDETIRGILNLKRFGQRVEIRVVVHQQTFKRLPRLAEFLARNLIFVDHVTFMGLEITGFTRANLDILWIDPVDYQTELRDAVLLLDSYGIQSPFTTTSDAYLTVSFGLSIANQSVIGKTSTWRSVRDARRWPGVEDFLAQEGFGTATTSD
jgi:His-Xaa-Ser system radical SAM maturase HxsC